MRIAFFIAATSAFAMAPLWAQRPDTWGSEKSAESRSEPRQQGDPAGDLGKPLDEVWRIVFRNSKGEEVALDCEVARTEKDKERGLMFRKTLAKNRGMIFVYNKPEEMNFWMRNTVIPLDIIFIGADRRILNIAADAVPYSETPLPSAGPVSAVLELNGGRAAQLGIGPGDKVDW